MECSHGVAFSNSQVQLNYAAYFSAGGNFTAVSRGNAPPEGQFAMYIPGEASGDWHLLLTDYFRASRVIPPDSILWWQPYRVPLAIRSEYAHGPHAQGYWVESAYRLIAMEWSRTAGWDVSSRCSACNRLFVIARDRAIHLPAVNTQRADFGLDYHLPHEVRINASYARQFSSTGDHEYLGDNS